MESASKRKKQKNNKNGSSQKTSPRKHLNGLQTRKPGSKKRSNPSSSAAPASVEASKGRLISLISSNSNSAASSASSFSSSSSKANFDRKPRPLSTITNNVSVKSSAVASKLPRSKENEVPIKPVSQKSKKIQPPCLDQGQSYKTNTKPTCKSAPRSKLSAGEQNPVSKLKSRSEILEAKKKNSQENGSGELPVELFGVSTGSSLNCIKSCTPAVKTPSGCGLGSVSCGDHKNVRDDSVSKTANGNSAAAVKTPPIEDSVSPEIHCGSQSKILVSKSAATPVCYGAGHLLSGVPNKRKCRRRGSLKGGCENATLFYDEKSDVNVSIGSQDSLIPLPAEASVHWLLSPCDEGREDHGSDSENRLDQCRMIHGNASLTLDSLSSPLVFFGNVSDLECDDGNFSSSGSMGDAANKKKARTVVLSPRKDTEFRGKDTEFRGLLGHSNKNMNEHFLATTPNSTSSCNCVSLKQEGDFGNNVTENDSAFSVGSLSSGNIIQTPNSDSSSDWCVGRSLGEVDHRNFVHSELDSITETLSTVGLSSTSDMSMWDAPGTSFQCGDRNSPSTSIGLTQLQENNGSVCSWMSDSTLENLRLSQMRISWRDGLVSKIDENDEFDCCQCLSDESKGSEENDLGLDNDISPMRLEYESCMSARGKRKLLPHRSNTCAESICTNGVDLVASGDSDWTYFLEKSLSRYVSKETCSG